MSDSPERDSVDSPQSDASSPDAPPQDDAPPDAPPSDASPADAPLPDVPSAESTLREVNEVTLHVVAAGDPDGPLVVLLHGFPEFWYCWREAVEPLVDAGYRVLVPDQRGYNLSDKPAAVGTYHRKHLSRDVVELVRTERRESAHVVGHDWGALVGWDLALRHPGVVDRLAVANGPHPSVFRRTRRTNPTQLRKSRYVYFFQLPRLPERSAAANDFDGWVEMFRRAPEAGAFAPEDVDHYRRAWARDGALTAMHNWYRAMIRRRYDPPCERVAAPTLVIWGEGDDHLIPEMAPASVDRCEDGRLETFPEASHWITHEYPEQVAELLVEHFQR